MYKKSHTMKKIVLTLTNATKSFTEPADRHRTSTDTETRENWSCRSGLNNVTVKVVHKRSLTQVGGC